MNSSLLSVCIIAKNEEKMLAECLASVASIAGEIILVDTGSTDDTIKIAESFGCTILHHPWQNDFSKARNVALAVAKNTWILSIDADERLLNPDDVIRTITSSTPVSGGFLVDVLSHAARADGGTDIYSSSLLRLFRNHPAIKFEGIIHEQILESILAQGLEITLSTIKFNHEGYNLSPLAMLEKQRRNILLLDVAIKQQPDHAYSYLNRAKTHLALGNITLAESDIGNAVQYAKPQSLILPQALCYAGVIDYQLNNYSRAIESAERSLSLIPHQSLAYFVLGEAFTALERTAEAIDAYQSMLTCRTASNSMAKVSGEYHLPVEQIYFRLGRSNAILGQWNPAEYNFKKGLEANSRDVSCLVGSANCAMRKNELDRAEKHLLLASSLEPTREDIRNYITQINLQRTLTNSTTLEPQRSDFFNKVYSTQSQPASEGKSIQETPIKKNQRPLLSLCMIVKNEENNLADCLKSVEGVADEIVIVDTGSIDSTMQIALSFGAKVFEKPWTGDFAEARNASLKECSGTWILYLDADERLHADAKVHLRSMLESMPEEIGGIVCVVISPHRQNSGVSEVHTGSYPRIFRNYGYPKMYFQGRVHEQITPSILALGGKVIMSEVEIYHLGYDQSREIMEQKVKRNYDLLIQHVKEEPENSYAWFQLGQTLARMELTDQAEQALKLALEFGTLSTTIAASAAATLAQIAGNQKKFTDALTWAELSLSNAPKQSYALHLKAYSLLYLGRAKESELAFLEVQKRVADQRGVPHTGFEVEIPPETIIHGLKEARKLLHTSA
ncbi:MAG: glycosyltransferase [Ignavibacteria bacterium]|nr:glycosyltransferase [Ignavibacteria bacterium]